MKRTRTHSWKGLRTIAVALLGALLGTAGSADADPSAALRAELERYVRERAPVEPTRVELPPLESFQAAWKAPGNVHVELSTSSRERFVGSVPITVSVVANGEEVKRGIVTARVRAERAVLVSTRPIPKGSIVHDDDVTEEMRDISSVPDYAIFDRDAVVGQRTARAVRDGALWRESLVRPPSIVARGQLVRLNLVHGSLRIDGLGKARQEGRPGDWIRVQNVDSRREVVGRVNDSGGVDVVL